MDTAAALRDRLFPAIATPCIDETWPLAACLTAQLCFVTDAPQTQRSPLRSALQAYPGRLAVLAGAAAESGPVERYVGLLTAPDDSAQAVALLASAAAECRQFGADIWTPHIDRDIVAVSGAIATAAPTT